MVVSGVVAGSVLWPARWSRGLIWRSAVAMVLGATPNRSARMGRGDCQPLPHDGDQGFLGEGHCLGVAAGGPAGCRAAACDVQFCFALGLVRDGQHSGELVPAAGRHPGQGRMGPAGALAAAGPRRASWCRGGRRGIQGVVPVVAAEGMRRHLLVADLYSGQVRRGVQISADA